MRIRLQSCREFHRIDQENLVRALKDRDSGSVQHRCRTLVGEKRKANDLLFVDHQPIGSCGLLAVERAQLKRTCERDCRFRGPGGHTFLPRVFLFGIPIEAEMPLVDTTGAVTDSFFFFGFRVSRLLRFCPLAMISSYMKPVRRCGRKK